MTSGRSPAAKAAATRASISFSETGMTCTSTPDLDLNSAAIASCLARRSGCSSVVQNRRVSPAAGWDISRPRDSAAASALFFVFPIFIVILLLLCRVLGVGMARFFSRRKSPAERL